jgi:hypothetical protein
MTVPYTLIGKPTSEEAIFTLRTFAEIQGMKHFSMSVDSPPINCFLTSLQTVPCTLIDALVSLIGSRGAAVEEKENIRN